MGLISRLFGTERRDSLPRPPDPFLMPYLPPLPFGTATSHWVGPDHAVSTLAVASRCVALISEGLASLPLVVFRKLEDGGREAVESHALARLLNDASNDRTSAFELRELLLRDLTTYGNSFCQIVRDRLGRVAELHYWPFSSVAVERLPTGRLRYRVTAPTTGKVTILLEEEVAHLRCFSRDGVMGVSPLQRAQGAVSLALAQAELAEAQASRGFVPDMAFETDTAFSGEMADDAFRRLKDQLSERMRMMSRDPQALLLEAGLKAKPLAAPGRDVQFHESRLVGLEDIARVFGVPPSVVGLGRNASYGSLNEESRALRQNCYSPWARRVEAQLALALLSEDGRRQYELEHDLSGLERGDLKARLEAYKLGIEAEIISPNEARVWEGMNKRDGGDTFRNPAVSQPSAEQD
jgi:HK97 family phage portal protein